MRFARSLDELEQQPLTVAVLEDPLLSTLQDDHDALKRLPHLLVRLAFFEHSNSELKALALMRIHGGDSDPAVVASAFLRDLGTGDPDLGVDWFEFEQTSCGQYFVEAVASQPLGAFIMERIARVPIRAAAWALAKRAALPRHAISQMLEWSDDDGVRCLLVENSHADIEDLGRLVRDREGSVRYQVAKSSKATQGILLALANDGDAEVRGAVASREQTQDWILSYLAMDSHPFVRSRVAANVGTPCAVLMQLAHDHSREVIAALIENPTCPAQGIERARQSGSSPNTLEIDVRNGDAAVNDPDSEATALARAQRPGVASRTLSRLASSPYASARIAVAANTDTPDAALDKLANDSSVAVRLAVARNPNTSVQTLDRLADDHVRSVQHAVAENDRASPSTLAKLALSPLSKTREQVAQHLHTPPIALVALAADEFADVRVEVARNWWATSSFPHLLDRLAKDALFRVRLAVAGNITTSPNTLDQLARDRNWQIRMQVAYNSNAHLGQLVALESDVSRVVRAAAAEQLTSEGEYE